MSKDNQNAAGIARDFLRTHNINVPFNTALELAAKLAGFKDLHQAQAAKPAAPQTPVTSSITIDEALQLLAAVTAVAVDGDELVYPELPEDGDENDSVAVRLHTQFGVKTFLREDNLTVKKEGPFIHLKDTLNPDETYRLTLLSAHEAPSAATTDSDLIETLRNLEITAPADISDSSDPAEELANYRRFIKKTTRHALAAVPHRKQPIETSHRKTTEVTLLNAIDLLQNCAGIVLDGDFSSSIQNPPECRYVSAPDNVFLTLHVGTHALHFREKDNAKVKRIGASLFLTCEDGEEEQITLLTYQENTPAVKAAPTAPGENLFRPAHGAVVSKDELRKIHSLLATHPRRQAAKQMIQRLREMSDADADQRQRKRIAAYQKKADEEHGSEGECEIDDDAPISEEDGKSEGAYVQAWVWVYKAGIPPKTEEEAVTLNEEQLRQLRHLPRKRMVSILEDQAGIQCYDNESNEVLAEAIRVNIEDGTLDVSVLDEK